MKFSFTSARVGKIAGILVMGAVVGAAFQNCSEALPTEAQTVLASQGASPLSIQAPSTNVASLATVPLTGAGGEPPYRFSVITGTGTLDASNVFTAPAVTETNVIEITDSKGNVSHITIEVLAPLTLDHSPAVALATEKIKLAATGGKAPYTYQLLAGVGTLTGDEFTPGNVAVATTLVQVTDAAGRTLQKSISVSMPAKVTLYRLQDVVNGSGPVLSTDPNAGNAFGYTNQGAVFSIFQGALAVDGRAILRCNSIYGAIYGHFTVNASCQAGFTNGGVAGYLSTTARPNTVAIYGSTSYPTIFSRNANDITSMGLPAAIIGYAIP